MVDKKKVLGVVLGVSGVLAYICRLVLRLRSISSAINNESRYNINDNDIQGVNQKMDVPTIPTIPDLGPIDDWVDKWAQKNAEYDEKDPRKRIHVTDKPELDTAEVVDVTTTDSNLYDGKRDENSVSWWGNSVKSAIMPTDDPNSAFVTFSGRVEYADDKVLSKDITNGMNIGPLLEFKHSDLATVKKDSDDVQIVRLESESSFKAVLNIRKVRKGFQVSSIEISDKNGGSKSYFCQANGRPLIKKVVDSHHFKGERLSFRCSRHEKLVLDSILIDYWRPFANL